MAVPRWVGLQLKQDELFSSVVCFTVVASQATPFVTTPMGLTLTYDIVLLNEGGAWLNNHFIAPQVKVKSLGVRDRGQSQSEVGVRS